jgi:hypothetical protein
MSRQNVEIAQRTYDAYNRAFDSPNPRQAIRAAFESSLDSEIEWHPVASGP